MKLEFDYLSSIDIEKNLIRVKEIEKNLDKDKEYIWTDLEKINKEAKLDTDILVLIGIGGSYSGIDAVLDFLNLDRDKILFLGMDLDQVHLEREIEKLKNIDFSINVISNSGNTLETLVAFNVLEELLKSKRDREYRNKIVVTTGNRDGELYKRAKKNGYRIIDLPKNLVGRYSVLHVSALILSFLGLSLDKIKRGALDALKDNEILRYVAIRYELSKKYEIDVFQSYSRDLIPLSRWWQQLFGESEGKNGKALFPTTLLFTRDLHSMGQYLQEGKKNFIQTTLFIDNNLKLSAGGMNYRFKGKSVSEINRYAMISTLKSHILGGSPNFLITLNSNSEYNLGFILFFFQKAAVLSSKMLKVNPYDNEGVSLYKKELYEYIK